MKKYIVAVAAAMLATMASAQLPVQVESIERLNIEGINAASSPVMSPDGKFVVCMTDDALVKVDIATGKTNKVANVEGAFEVCISPDGEQVAWLEPSYINNRRYVSARTTRADGREAVTEVVAPSRRINTGLAFSGRTVGAVDKGVRRSKATKGARAEVARPIASIDYGQLVITVGDKSTAIDPQGRGSYLWPQISPDGKKVVYWHCSTGCYVCDLDGSNVRYLGILRAARWCGNDMVVGMLDIDDGVRMLSSEIVLSDLNGNKMTLTDDNMIAVEPTASADGRTIAFSADDAGVYIINLKKK